MTSFRRRDLQIEGTAECTAHRVPEEVLNLNSMKGQVSVEADRKQFEVNALTASISDATLEQLKSRDMEKASDAADEIMDLPIKRSSEC